ncbi:MAG TPA: hypothetical protein ENL06_01610 [Candidatus Portnoybacteria bacterium]|nr:hypothetical protein [Candidatus Portnoybacteria bacterium]
MKLFHGKKTSRGFTLAEIMTVLFITLLVLGMGIFNYHSGQETYNLNNAVNKLIANIRQAEHWSVVGKNYSGTFPKGGYGIYLTANNSSYIIFANNSTTTHSYGGAITPDIETISLPKKVIIQSLTPVSPLNIVFQPPWPVVYVNNSTTTSATITLKDTLTNKTKTITINNQGGINF